MIEKTKTEICILLPAGNNCQTCIDRLQLRIAAHPGIEVTHIDATGDSPRMCVHYNPEQIGPSRVQAIMAEEGARLEAQYYHESLSISGMDCADCARTLESGVRRLVGVLSADANFASGTLSLEYDAGLVDRTAIAAHVRELGYDLASVEPSGELTFRVEGLDCADCALHLEEALRRIPGIAEASVDFSLARARLVPGGSADVVSASRRVAREMGYSLVAEGAGASDRGSRGAWAREHRRELTTAASGLLILLALALHLLHLPEPFFTAANIAAIIAGGYSVVRAGWASLRSARSLDMNALMSIAAIGSIVIGESAEGAVAIFLFSLGNLLESYTMDRARRAIRGLMDLSPRRATLLRGERDEQVPVEALRAGDRILVRPGERIPMDGQVIAGESAVNQAPVTGESQPADVVPGSDVFAGTVNGQGALTVRVSRLASDSTIARIIRMVEEAQAQKAPSQRFVDRFARVYTPIVIGVAVAVALVPPLAGFLSGAGAFWPLFLGWLHRALVLLVIACPCALVISTPVTIVSAIAGAARRGVLIKGGSHLEALGRLRVMAFDKTGTLTSGKPQVVRVRCLDHVSETPWPECEGCLQVLADAAAVERRSEHPIAQAIVRQADALGLLEGQQAAALVEALTGRGVRGQRDGHVVTVGSHSLVHENHPELVDGPLCSAVHSAQEAGHSAMVVEEDGLVLGAIVVADTLRPGVREVMRTLQALGIERTVMLTGDNEATARAVGQSVGVEVRAGLLPEHKVTAIEALLDRHGAVAMVGDGVNDAPALARATVGIAMGAAGTDAALETADVALMGDDLSLLPFAVRLSRQARRVVAQNVVLALGIKALFLALALAGLATMWMAVFADVGASLLVTLNGMRLLRQK
ncbi:MAG TPA: heavy metal translocating P-type ATPase [Anaerolineae bacterium]|nr:heavy metal translocating P-type ATPase [Anaerolineae bacterium]